MRIIRGRFGRRRFDVPTNITARPTTDFAKENIFNVIENITDIEGARVLDLFAGTGAITFEFLSRGAIHVTSVEKASTQYNFIKKVSQMLGVESELTLIRGDVMKFLGTGVGNVPEEKKFDIIFADPPYDLKNFAEIPEKIIESGYIALGGIVIVEHGRNYDFSNLAGFMDHRVYGSVNFSIFRF